MRRRSLLVIVLVLLGCARTIHRTEIARTDLAALESDGILRAHLHDGGLLLLQPWRLESDRAFLSGRGRRFDTQRNVVNEGSLEIALDEVAVLELDELSTAQWPVGMGVVTVLSLGVTLACAANPKACFGSCPTFYVDDRLLAEGFSASFAPALEATDLDHLGPLPSVDGRVRIEMRNEAIETHYVRGVELLAIEHDPAEQVAADAAGRFWRVRRAGALISPHAELLDAADGVEYFSLADSTDLATKEELPLAFALDAADAGELALLVDSRQSLMSTYLFYQGIAYLGSHYGRWLASLRGDAPTTGAEGMVELLGEIEIQILRGDDWTTLATFAETGPLASDRKLVPLPGDWNFSRDGLRLRMTRGMWRIDAVQLVRMEKSVEPRPLSLLDLLAEGDPDVQRRALLSDRDRHLMTWPGESFTLEFESAKGPASYFLRSRGYYVEWMRDRWLEEENLPMALAMFREPAQTLRRLAPQYKRLESEMEHIFWESRYAKP